MKEETYGKLLGVFTWVTVGFIIVYIGLWIVTSFNSLYKARAQRTTKAAIGRLDATADSHTDGAKEKDSIAEKNGKKAKKN